jgi:DNA-binding NarL/FixJ family response regulator
MPLYGASRERIQVLVADGSRMVSQLLGEAVRRDHRLRLVSTVFGSDAFFEASQAKVDVALISANLDENPPGTGFSALRQFRTSHPGIRAVMLLNSSTRTDVLEAFRSGARGVLCRSQSLKVLSRCIRCVHEGQIWVSSEELEFILDALARAASIPIAGTKPSVDLTPREQDVIRSVAGGLTNRQIATRLEISEHTVKNYLLHIFEKLGVSSRVELLLHVVGRLAPQTPVASIYDIADDHCGNFETNRLHQAAEHGCPSAQVCLAKKYLEGSGLPQDYVTSYMWLSVAEKISGEVLGDCTNLKRQLRALLTSEQLSEGERRVINRTRQLDRRAS